MSVSYPVLCTFDVGLAPVATFVRGEPLEGRMVAMSTEDVMIAAFRAGGMPIRAVIMKMKLKVGGRVRAAGTKRILFNSYGGRGEEHEIVDPTGTEYAEWYVETGVYGWSPVFMHLHTHHPRDTTQLVRTYGAVEVDRWLALDARDVIIGAAQTYCTHVLALREAHPSLPASPALAPERLYHHLRSMRRLNRQLTGRARTDMDLEHAMDVLVNFTRLWQRELDSSSGACEVACDEEDVEPEFGAKSAVPTFGFISTGGRARVDPPRSWQLQ